jgi:acetyltransferase-like isoleucine patch superfamily enzyme
MIHPTSDVQTPSIGTDSTVWQYCVILKNARIGDHCNINAHCFIENDVVVGDNVTVKSGVQLWDGITLEDNVFVGPNVTFTNDLTPRSKQYPEAFAKTVVRRGATLGANSTIIAGVTVGAYAMVGAGSVVTHPVPPHALVYGNPARQHGWVCECGHRLPENLQCTACTRGYAYHGDGLELAP